MPIDQMFDSAYRALEARMRALAETDGDVFLPNPKPLAPVQDVLICMEACLPRGSCQDWAIWPVVRAPTWGDWSVRHARCSHRRGRQCCFAASSAKRVPPAIHSGNPLLQPSRASQATGDRWPRGRFPGVHSMDLSPWGTSFIQRRPPWRQPVCHQNSAMRRWSGWRKVSWQHPASNSSSTTSWRSNRCVFERALSAHLWDPIVVPSRQP